MNKKDYRAIAEILKVRMGDEDVRPVKETVSEIARELATAFKSDNPNFRYDMFYAACGLNEWGE